ncbi:MAG TPA: alpha/beta hydrolase [Bryobacteraceae bacterium]|nr:alpha/beta hydrolase [Bryobacteraceae bacterium]
MLLRVLAGSAAFWLGACAPLLPAQAAEAIHEGYAALPGVRLFYRDTGGRGTPVVLLHANTGSSRVWEYQIPAFRAAGYRVIAFDRRGWGRTEVEPGAKDSTAADDLRALLDSLGIQRIHLVGTGGGGFVAFDFALSYPERMRSLVVANSIGGIQDAEFLELNRRLRPPQFAALPPEIREVGPSYRAANPQGTGRWIELEKISRPPGPLAPAQPLRNRLTLALLENIQVPTLLLTGGADLFAPPPVARMLAAHVRGAGVVIVPEAGHSTYWEQPEQFNRAVLQFLAKH